MPMSEPSIPRKIAFNLYPADEAGDKLAADLLDETRLKERGRAMRAFLLTGAALAAVDRRLPFLIAELASDTITLQEIQRIIQSVIPDAFGPDDATVRAVLARLGGAHLDLTASAPAAVAPAVPERSEEEIAREATRANSNRMFGDDD